VLKYLKNKKVVFLDSETTIEDFPRMLSFQIGDGFKQFIIDVRYGDMSFLFPILRSKEVTKVGHNIKFDYKVLKHNFGLVMENIFDTMLGEQVLYTGLSQAKGFYSLEQTAIRYTKISYYSSQLSLFTPYAPKKTRMEISKNLVNPFSDAELYYMAADIMSVVAVFAKQTAKLKEESLLTVAEEESEVALAVGDMELNGMKIDTKRWMQLGDWAVGKKEEQLAILKELADINWNSHLQVKKVFKERGLNLMYKGKESVEEKAISKYKNDPVIDAYLKYKGFEKLNTTYGFSFLKHVADDNRIHSNFQQIMVTGRMSSQSPNLNWAFR
jgi:DNA polymerase-1